MDIACSCSTISKIRDKCLLHGWDLHVNVEVHGKVELVYDQLLYKMSSSLGGDNPFCSKTVHNVNDLQLFEAILQFGEVDDQLCESSYEFWIRIFVSKTKDGKLTEFVSLCIRGFPWYWDLAAHPSFSNILSVDFFKSQPKIRRKIHGLAAYSLEVGMI
ncbi:hypothetical protein Tco_0621136 [Tanacetum coccineum]